MSDEHLLRLRAYDGDLRKQLAVLIWWEFGWVGDDERVRASAERAADAILRDQP